MLRLMTVFVSFAAACRAPLADRTSSALSVSDAGDGDTTGPDASPDSLSDAPPDAVDCGSLCLSGDRLTFDVVPTTDPWATFHGRDASQVLAFRSEAGTVDVLLYALGNFGNEGWDDTTGHGNGVVLTVGSEAPCLSDVRSPGSADETWCRVTLHAVRGDNSFPIALWQWNGELIPWSIILETAQVTLR